MIKVFRPVQIHMVHEDIWACIEEREISKEWCREVKPFKTMESNVSFRGITLTSPNTF